MKKLTIPQSHFKFQTSLKSNGKPKALHDTAMLHLTRGVTKGGGGKSQTTLQTLSIGRQG